MEIKSIYLARTHRAYYHLWLCTTRRLDALPRGPKVIWPQHGPRRSRVPGIRQEFTTLEDAIRAAASSPRAKRTYGPRTVHVVAAWELPPTDRSVEAAIQAARALLAARGIEL
jgi:hypothetical protein